MIAAVNHFGFTTHGHRKVTHAQSAISWGGFHITVV
jgi:hypothetical protein